MLKNIIILFILSSCVSRGFYNHIEHGELQKKEELMEKAKKREKDNVDGGLPNMGNMFIPE
jgi:hypothetical protein